MGGVLEVNGFFSVLNWLRECDNGEGGGHGGGPWGGRRGRDAMLMGKDSL